MEEQEYISLAGSVAAVIYQNADNGYTVLRLETEDGSETTVVGCIPGVVPGEKLEVFGNWARHPQHGAQFKAEWSQRTLPDTEEGIYSYLASGAIKGIGPATATLLLDRFGTATLDVIETAPERLAELRGISRKKAMQLSERFRKQVGLRRLMEFLASHALRPVLALRLYQCYGDAAHSIIRDNPYVLADEQVGGGFDEADKLALSMGLEADSPQRIRAAILHELSFNAGQGHVFIPRDKLAAVTAQLLNVDSQLVFGCLDALTDSGDVVREFIAGVDAYYLAQLYADERYTAARLLEMSQVPDADLDAGQLIARIEAEGDIHYAPLQKKAIAAAAVHQIMVLTGGPGTGKTTCVRAILSLFDRMGLTTVLAAPTGRASKRLEELSGREAKTVHRLLEAGGTADGRRTGFRRDEDKPLECDAVVLDEMSMVDITLMSALLRALPEGCRLVLVGDADQLPSVGPGRVFSDIIRSGVIETVRLTEIFRQSARSDIVRLAHEINRGELPELTRNSGDFFFLRRRDAGRAADTIVELCAKRLPEKMHIPVHELQVLTPTRKGEMGTRSLNARLQAALNPAEPGKKEHNFGEIVFREGDRVMQIKNNYDIMWYKRDFRSASETAANLWADTDDGCELSGTGKLECGLGVYNGDIGYLLSIDEDDQSVIVDYDGRQAKYSFEMLSELDHAWAMTVHKSQGSEYHGVVLAIMRSAPRLMTRGVLYTAVTRARELLVAVGEEETVKQMVENHRVERRYSGLRARLADACQAG